jgi:outer membrane receptor protein involved in Fe transport
VEICHLAVTLLGAWATAAIDGRVSYTVVAPQNAEARSTDVKLVVQGEKSNRPLQDTPTSVAITTSGEIHDQNLISVYDILDRTPNVTVEGNRTTFSIRGVDAFNVSGGGDGALASVYVDGAPMPRLALASGPLDLYDIAQVEIFRGPQSTIQGRNALAGAIVVNTADPSSDWTGKARLLLTDRDDQTRAGAIIGGPIAGDQLAFRLVGEKSAADGLIGNISTRGEGDRQRSETLRGKLLVTPHALPGLRMVGSYLHDLHQRGTFYSEIDPPYNPRQRLTTSDIEDVKRVRSAIATLAVSYEIEPGSVLKSVSSYSRIRFRSVSDADRTAVPGQVSRIDDLDRSFQQEVRFSFHKSWVEGLVGAYYLDQTHSYSYLATQSLSLASLGVDRQLQTIGLPPAAVDAILDLYGRNLPIRNSLSHPGITHNHAAFADLAFPLSDRLRLRFGLRYDAETQRQSTAQQVEIDRILPDPASLPSPALAPVVGQLNDMLRKLVRGANSAVPARRVRYHALLPKIGFTYDMAKNMALSFTVQQGYRTGGSGFNQQRARSYDFGPEKTINYEWALRSAWFRQALTLNANAYRTDWKNQQVPVQLTPGAIYDTQVINVGKSRLYGLELEGRSMVTRTFSLYAGAGFTSARFTDFSIDSGTLALNAPGKDFPRAPRWTVSGGATFTHPDGWFANLNANHRGAYYQDIINQSVRDIRPRTLINAKLGWQGQHFGAFLIATNILNVQKPDQFFRDLDGRRRGTLNDPRIFGLSFEGPI